MLSLENFQKCIGIPALKNFLWHKVSWLVSFIGICYSSLCFGLSKLKFPPGFVPEETSGTDSKAKCDALAAMVASMKVEEMKIILSPMLDVIGSNEVDDIIKDIYESFKQKEITLDEIIEKCDRKIERSRGKKKRLTANTTQKPSGHNRAPESLMRNQEHKSRTKALNNFSNVGEGGRGHENLISKSRLSGSFSRKAAKESYAKMRNNHSGGGVEDLGLANGISIPGSQLAERHGTNESCTKVKTNHSIGGIEERRLGNGVFFPGSQLSDSVMRNGTNDLCTKMKNNHSTEGMEERGLANGIFVQESQLPDSVMRDGIKNSHSVRVEDRGVDENDISDPGSNFANFVMRNVANASCTNMKNNYSCIGVEQRNPINGIFIPWSHPTDSARRTVSNESSTNAKNDCSTAGAAERGPTKCSASGMEDATPIPILRPRLTDSVRRVVSNESRTNAKNDCSTAGVEERGLTNATADTSSRLSDAVMSNMVNESGAKARSNFSTARFEDREHANAFSVPKSRFTGAVFSTITEDTPFSTVRRMNSESVNKEMHREPFSRLTQNDAQQSKLLERWKPEHEVLKQSQKKHLRMIHTCPPILCRPRHKPKRNSTRDLHFDIDAKILSCKITDGIADDSSRVQDARPAKVSFLRCHDSDNGKDDDHTSDPSFYKRIASRIPVLLRMAGDCSALEGNSGSSDRYVRPCSPRRPRTFHHGNEKHHDLTSHPEKLRPVTPHPRKQSKSGHSRSRSGPAFVRTSLESCHPDADTTKQTAESVKVPSKADAEFVNIKVSLEFEKQFKSFAKFRLKGSTGIVITEYNSERWFRQATLMDRLVTPQECTFFFRQLAGTGVVLPIQKYMHFLCHLAKYKGIPVEIFMLKLATCGLPEPKKAMKAYHFGAPDSDEGM